MRLNPVVTLFVAAYLCCVNAGPVQETQQISYSQKKCTGMFSWIKREKVSKCTYRCWYFRLENEPDGISCVDGDGEGVCMNGKCVKKELYSTTLSKALSTPTYATTFTNAPTPPKSPPNADVASVLEDTMIITDSSDKLFHNSDVPGITQRTLTTNQQTTRHEALTTPRYETLEPHAVSSFSTGTQAPTTVKEWTTAYAATSFDGLSADIIITTPKGTVTSSSYQDARLPASTEDTMIRTQAASSDGALSTSSSVTSVHHGNTGADHDLMRTDTLPHQKGDFTEGLTTLIPHAPTSWKERSIATADTTPEETVTSSSYQDARLSASTEDTMIRTQEVSSDGALSTSSSVTSVHHGKAGADHDLMQTEFLSHQKGDFTEGITTLIPHEPTLWKERSIATANTAHEETVTSFSYQGARVSASTEDTNSTEITVTRTQETSTAVASTSPSSLISVHHGTTHVDQGGIRAFTTTHQNGGFTDGPATPSRRPITSPGTNSGELTSSPTHAEVHSGTVSDVVPVVRLSTIQAAPSTHEPTATANSTSKQYFAASGFPGKGGTATGNIRENASTPHPTSPGTYLLTTISLANNQSIATSAERENVSVLILSRSTTPNDGSLRANSTTPSHNLFTRTFQDTEQAVTEANEGDISVGNPTLSDQILTYSFSATKRDIAPHSAHTEEPSTKMSYATKAETKINSSPVRTVKFSTTSGSITFNQSAGTDVSPTEVVTASKTLEVGISAHYPTSAEPHFFSSVGSTREEISSSAADAELLPGKEWDTSAEVITSPSQRKPTKQSYIASASSTDMHYDPEVKQQSTVPSVKWENEASAHHSTTLTQDSTTSAESTNQDISLSTARMTMPSNKEGDDLAALTTITREQVDTEQKFTSIYIPDEQYAPHAENQNATAAIMPHLPTMRSEDATSSMDSTSNDIPAISTDIKMISKTRSVAKTTSQLGTTEESFRSPAFFTSKKYASHNTQKTAIATEHGEKHLSTHHPTTPDQDLTSYAKSTNKETLSSSETMKISSSKEIDAQAAVSKSTSKPKTVQPTFADATFSTDQRYAYPDREQSVPVILHLIVSTQNPTTANFGLPTSAVSAKERFTSTSVRPEWPSSTEKAALEERSRNNNQATTTQIVAMASTFSTPGYHTEGRSISGRVQPIATTSVEDESTGASATLPQNATLFPSSSKEATSNTARTVSSSTEMREHSGLEGSSEQETRAEKVSTAPASAASAQFPGSTSSPDNNTSSATRDKGDNLRGSTEPSLQVTPSSHSRSEERKSESALHRQKAMLLAFCAIFLFITVLKLGLRKRKTV